MKYQNALNEKNLTKEMLAVRTQKKIESIQFLKEKIDKAIQEGVDEDELDEYKDMYEEMDNDLVKAVNKFNPNVYKARLERVAEVNKMRESKPKEEPSEPRQPKQTQQVEKADLGKKLDDLKKTVQIDKQKFRTEPEVNEPEVEVVDDFEKKKEVKPKKGFWYFAIGIGGLILTYGAVNLFKERR
jgi:succinate dehydrogenase flavin-adding protein (antitoxin of CptAB toxin-antitoxin module)